MIIYLIQKVTETQPGGGVKLFIRPYKASPHLFLGFPTIPTIRFQSILQSGGPPTLFDLCQLDTPPAGTTYVEELDDEKNLIGFRLPVEPRTITIGPLFPADDPEEASELKLPETFPDWLSWVAHSWLRTHYPSHSTWNDGLVRTEEEPLTNIKINRKNALDSVTHLPRHSFFSRYLERYMNREENRDSGFALFIMDLDKFSRINVSLGHQMGDRVLLEVANRMRNQLPDPCFLSRWGGDEFAILVPDVQSRQEIETFATRLFKILRTPIEVSDTKLFLKGSVGAVLYPDDGENPEDLVTKLDQALKSAKQDTGNSYSLYTAGDREIALRQLLLTTELHQALNKGEFLLHYQPILEADSGELRAAESLIRWNHPDRGILNSGTFIDLLEDTGLILFIGQWILETAADQIQDWKQNDLDDLRLCLNMSARQFRDPSLIEKIESVYGERGIRMENLELEITERTLLEDLDYSREILHELQAMGVRISLDDFGTGHSSFQYLADLPLDVLKIDRSFLESFDRSSRKGKLIDIISLTAHRLDMVSVAEGVETSRQLEYVRECGCDLVQGFYFSRPLDPTSFLQYVQRTRGSKARS